MKQKKYISYWVLILCLFWFLGTVLAILSTEQSAKPKKDTSQTELAAYQAKAVIPAIGTATLSPNYFLIFEVSFLLNNVAKQSFQNPIFKISFFEKIFEHLIAPQAP